MRSGDRKIEMTKWHPDLVLADTRADDDMLVFYGVIDGFDNLLWLGQTGWLADP